VLGRLRIQSKLILLLLVVTLASIAAVAWIGYASGRDSLAQATADRLTAHRVGKTATLDAMLRSLRNEVLSLSDTRRVVEGMRDLRIAFRDLSTRPLSPAEQAKLDDFYATDFLPKLGQVLDVRPEPTQYIPDGVAGRVLQYRAIVANPHPYGEKQELAELPDDDSAYARVHAEFHPHFARTVRIFGFEDLMLVDVDTLDIVYSYQKTTELGTSLEDGPYAGTKLAAKVREMRGDKDRDDYRVVDFERYRPSLGRAMGFVISPIFDGARIIGILALKFPIDAVNKALTNGYDWRAEGLGDTGECYLVGPDGTLRSRSRGMHEHPQEFLAELRSAGVSASVVEQVERQGSGMCVLPVGNAAVEEALRGRSGLMQVRDYRGVPVSSAYGPVELGSLRWALMTEIDVAEADAPIRRFGSKVFGVACGLALASSLVALLFAHLLTRPLAALADAARRLGAGETDVSVPVGSLDEFGQLSSVFNDMAANIRRQKQELESQMRRNEDLLHSILPASAVEQRRAGDERASREFADVSVLCAELVGLEQLCARIGETKALAAVGDLVTAIDEAADSAGVEKVRAIGGSYLAVCGLSVARPDHARRIVTFAREVERIVRVFARDQQADLRPAIGINCGPVVGSVMGRTKFLYDLWGDTVVVARRLAESGDAAIHVTARVRERAGDVGEFRGPQPVVVEGRPPIETWSLV